MLALKNPSEAYRRVDFDARVNGARPEQLVALCYEQLIAALGSALFAHERADNRAKSEALTRAVSALTALHMGVSGDNGTARALIHLYDAARRRVLDSVIVFKPEAIAEIRDDFREIAAALTRG